MLMQMIAWSYNQAENTLWSSFYQDQAKLSNLDNYSNIFIVLPRHHPSCQGLSGNFAQLWLHYFVLTIIEAESC